MKLRKDIIFEKINKEINPGIGMNINKKKN